MPLKEAINHLPGFFYTVPLKKVHKQDDEDEEPEAGASKSPSPPRSASPTPQHPDPSRIARETIADAQLKREIAALEIFERSRGSHDGAVTRFLEDRPAEVFMCQAAEIGISVRDAVAMLEAIRRKALRLYSAQAGGQAAQMPASFLRTDLDFGNDAMARGPPEQAAGPTMVDMVPTPVWIGRPSISSDEMPGTFPPGNVDVANTTSAASQYPRDLEMQVVKTLASPVMPDQNSYLEGEETIREPSTPELEGNVVYALEKPHFREAQGFDSFGNIDEMRVSPHDRVLFNKSSSPISYPTLPISPEEPGLSSSHSANFPESPPTRYGVTRPLASISNGAYRPSSTELPITSVYAQARLSDVSQDPTPSASGFEHNLIAPKDTDPIHGFTNEGKGMVISSWSPLGFSIETPYSPAFEEHMFVLENSVHHLRDSIDKNLKSLFEGIEMLGKSAQKSTSENLVEKSLHDLRHNIKKKLDSIKSGFQALSEGLLRGQTMSPAVFNLLWETMVQLNCADRNSFISYPIATFKHVIASHAEDDIKLEHEMAALLHNLKRRDEKCQMLEDTVEHLKYRNELLDAENRRLDSETQRFSAENRKLDAETRRLDAQNLAHNEYVRNIPQAASVAYRKRRVRFDDDDLTLNEKPPENSTVFVEDNGLTPEAKGSSAENMTLPEKDRAHIDSSKPAVEDQMVSHNSQEAVEECDISDDLLADRYRALKHSIAGLVKTQYANKPVSPIPSPNGSRIVTFQILFFRDLLEASRDKRRFRICGLVFKYLNDTIFTRVSIRFSEQDILTREMASGLLEILRPLRCHADSIGSTKTSQSTGEELRAHMIGLCDEAVSLAMIMHKARARYRFETLEPGTAIDASVLTVANVLLAKDVMKEPERVKTIAECVFGSLVKSSGSPADRWELVAKGEILLE